MATNKRKEAAALFELIDKSTLKVPKHAGALKIPDWWSSKTNPAPPPSPPIAPPSPAKSSEGTPEPAKSAVTPASLQPRLFEPPPADARPVASPSIRPPAPASSRPAAPPPQAPPTPSVTVATEKSAPAAPAPRRQFLPQTMEQGPDTRPQWGGPQRRRMARMPRWAILAAILGVVIVISLLTFLVLSARKHSADKANEPAISTVQQTPGDRGATLLPPMAARSPAPAGNSGTSPPLSRQPVTGGLLPPAQPTEEETPTEPGKVYAAGTVARSPELYYVRITTTPTLSVAKKSADFLASKGVDVSIEIERKTRLYELISVKGFPTIVEGEPFRKQIVRIGHEHPDFKKYHKVWDDAFLTHVTSVGK